MIVINPGLAFLLPKGILDFDQAQGGTALTLSFSVLLNLFLDIRLHLQKLSWP